MILNIFSVDIGSVLGGSIETALETEAASFLNSSRSLLDGTTHVATVVNLS